MSKEEIEELKVYLTGVKNAFVSMEQMGNCRICGKYKDLRCGVCWDCGMPVCKRDHCPFRKLVYCGQGRKQIFVDFRDYIGYDKTGKVRCDRGQGLCSDREFAIGLDKEPNLTPVNIEDNCFRKAILKEKSKKASFNP